MILGVDFDNTLVCYDGLFHAAAVARGLMPEDGPQDKNGVRDWLIEHGRGDDFTLLQGETYGPGLGAARPYPDALECLAEMQAAGAMIYVVSHKTATPVLGPAYDLRAAARAWLAANGFLTPGPVAEDAVFFEDTMAAKAARVAALGCTHFVDDMERFLMRPDFPAETARLWFRPVPSAPAPELAAFASWCDLAAYLEAED